MNIFIVYAHQEPQSFNGAMLESSLTAFRKENHTVTISDLYAMEFNPVATEKDFLERQNVSFFKYSKEQAKASSGSQLSSDICREQEKLFACDLLIFQFPLWWYGLPAILKGWVDRVITKGTCYSDGKIYDRGIFKNKKALLVFTTGGTPNPTVANEDIEKIAYLLSHGIFYFLGFEVLKPFIVFSPARMSDNERSEKLIEYAQYLEGIHKAPRMEFLPLEYMDVNYSLNCSSTC